MIKYIAFTILNLLFTLVAYPLSPLVALFTKSDGYLPNWLAWFQTQDAPLDAGWQDGYFGDWKQTGEKPSGFDLWWLRVRWLWRNPAYGFCYWPLGLAYDRDDWIVTKMTLKPNSNDVLEFEAVDSLGNFSKLTAAGGKYGYKLWWALDDNNQLLETLGSNRGPDNRLPLAFTPKL